MFSIDRIVDLTRPIDGSMAMWPGTPAPIFETKVTVEENGFFVRYAHLWEHTGTHVDAPAHFIADGPTVESLHGEQLVCPVVVIDVTDRCAGKPDYAVTLDDVERFESVHGRVPAACAVLLRTGWDSYGNDRERYMGPEGTLHFPGIGEDAASLLVERRGVFGLGIDTLGIDPGNVSEFSVHRHATLPHGAWNLEGLVNLGEVPPVGAWLVVGALPLVGGSGAPARVFALVG
jgi:kynurenine formamidase